MVAAANNWTKLKGICFSFQKLSSKKYSDAVAVMNNAYSGEITHKDFKSLFTDDTQTALKPDAFTLLKELIKKSLTADATKTEPGYRTTFITKLVDSAPFTYSWHNSDIKCKFCTLDNFNKLLNQSCNDPDLYGYVKLDIDELHFAHDFLPRNLEQVSFEDQFSPGPVSAPQRGGLTPRAPAPVLQSAMVHFNLTTLPADIRVRVQKHRSDDLMTMKEMTPYVDVLPERTRDPTGNTKRIINCHQVTPQRIFARSGEMYYFGPLDAKQEDRFIRDFSVYLLDTPPGRRRWYEH